MPSPKPPQSPFQAQRLEGWAPDNPNVSFPVTFAVHQEGPNLGLYLAPCNLSALQRNLNIPETDHAVVLHQAAEPTIVPWSRLGELGAEVEIVHLPEEVDPRVVADGLPYPLLAGPDWAVPTKLGSKVAISLFDGCHGVVLCRKPAHLARCLRGFLADYLEAAMGRKVRLPTLSDELLSPLVAPIEPGSWYGIRVDIHKRYWALDIEHHQDGEAPEAERWVCEGEGGHWRGGWSW